MISNLAIGREAATRGAERHYEKCLGEFRSNPEEARNYFNSKGVITKFFLEKMLIGDTIKYHAAKQVLAESGEKI